MRSLCFISLTSLLLLPCGCADRALGVSGSGADLGTDGTADETGFDETASTVSTGDGDGDPGDGDGGTTTTDTGDGDGDDDGDSGDGDGDDDGDTGDGDGDTGDGDTGDGDGDTGDGDGDTGDGDGDTGDGDGDTGDGDTGDGDGDGDDLLDLGDFSISATEISVDQYAQFLFDDVGFEGLPETCSWKIDYLPDSWNSQSNDDLDFPVVGVDWCDAWAYCEWSGAHLCGLVGGQPAALSDLNDAVNNEWYRACSADGAMTYPYADSYDPTACNGAELGVDELALVGSLDTCEGGAPGLFDMSGNAWEWTSACADSPDTDDNTEECRRRGGSYFSSDNILRCAVSSTRPRDFRSLNTSFRCCGNLP
ncbi:Formylglycine-generating sulfatase enzyme [Enhygromyxa salina]|uniref:Formylglycine-generating sulfatase enzyme n=1 Tax=Enhygromyxa salina TaxID=215803 RepID=A0A2S9XMG8_9BACT|nr:SUMF1/EgtB/PvdO family nonheme iron enzyme [Enhygromyxa salina]PRP94053.1 Formylglycine-generating sulfatase enzyme [Enhygromyxa salina]